MTRRRRRTNITVTVGGGQAPYRFSITGAAPFQTSNVFTNVAAGTYNIVALDNNNCLSTFSTPNPLTITQPATSVSAAATATAILCAGGCVDPPPPALRLLSRSPTSTWRRTSTVTITASGGTGALEYSLDGATFQPSNVFVVGAGSYALGARRRRRRRRRTASARQATHRRRPPRARTNGYVPAATVNVLDS